ncbi:protoporphyrinogen oxidase [Corynebacterium sanguinis]|uniref:Coproporphyrinogen III oxidase n=2 Tax=Corynebacterium sanguinis TaxID=2594913 RepID=A0A6I7RAA3_9CORY|nr:protoporphyrinogen oxidase [Corynebacterium sanguinis]MBA4505174.1 protoporphyrinogen oxidase [Corynebacterium sanguinis]MCT1413365.1 protoporphyrinogen oxidase [Corynebacterium sanguinis]MCT1463310.1 protoporphyrinogen oxidase [Corynebacterium sanguinis]MCT1498482.1 protoporphyrinogen oxidase [Corynebacterium sanguinis]MCT1555068.1 protoporphyrinogen oxidase [Corynebacterium sanguinis]
MRIAIVGAGLAGLTAAYELREHDVDVYEATDRIGGKLHTVAFEAGPTDMGAEAFLAHRADMVDFVAELGLTGSLVEPSGLGSLVYTGGSAKPLPRGGVMGIPSSGQAVAHLVSAETASRIDAESTAPGFTWDTEGDRSVGELVRARYGDEVADRVVSALLGGVYSCSADDLGVRATVPQLAAELDRLATGGAPVHLSTAVKNLEESRAQLAGTQGAVFNSFRDGYQELYEALAEQSGADIYVDSFISGITREGEGYRLTGGEDAVYDTVILAVPAPTAGMLLRAAAPEAASELAGIKLANSVVVGMRFATEEGLPHNSGVLIAADEEGLTAKAFTLSSRKWPHLAARGGALVRASFGRFGDDIALRADEDTLVDAALDDLHKVTGFDGRAAGLEEIYVQRWLGGLPRFDATHLSTVARVRARLAAVPGIDVVGAWVSGVGVPDVVAHARRVAADIAGA